MPLHIVVGAGPIGSATALRLALAGHDVRILSRSGGGPQHPAIDRVPCDAKDPVALQRTSAGASAIYNCVNPSYTRWATDWPPIASALLEAAASSGAVLVTMGNLYGYGPVDHPMTEADPLNARFTNGRVRAAMWRDALGAHRAGRIRATEARASDFFGPGADFQSILGRALPRLLAGKPAVLYGDPDALHSWTFVQDIAESLVVLGTDPRAWGRAWHVPTNPPLSQRDLLAAAAKVAGAPEPRLTILPPALLRVAGVVSPLMRRLGDVSYQFDQDFVVDSSLFTSTFGKSPTPLGEALAATIAWWQDERTTTR